MIKKLILHFFIFLLFASCSKEPPPPLSMLMYTTEATSINSNGATCGGTILADGGSTITQRGVCWNTLSNPTINNNKTINGSGTGSYTSNISGLSSNTNYYARAFAVNNYGTFYGNQITFKTTLSFATVYTTNASSITTTSAVCGGSITANGGSAITQRGVCWNTSPTPTTSNSRTIDGSGNGSYSSNLSSLTSNTTYYVRAYAINSLGTTSYGNEISFTTSIGVPSISTISTTSITSTTAYSGGTITSSGSTAITQKGVCWNTSTNPTTSNYKTNNGAGGSSFSSYITALTPNTVYFVRAYAVNSYGTAYGNEYVFTTTASLPVLTTSNISSIAQNTAISGGTISSDGGATITQRGVCWSTSSTPTISNNKTVDGTGAGTFTSNISGLSSYTTYYIAAYATNAAGTTYGNALAFITGPIADIDGNTYPTILVCGKYWMKTNLKTNKYRNGDVIPSGLSNTSWANTTTGAQASANGLTANDATYGKLYNWYAATDSRGLCPNSWHIPTKQEFDDLITCAGGTSAAGGNLKSTSIWNSPNSGATNLLGFTALPAGFRQFQGTGYFSFGDGATFWSQTSNGGNKWSIGLNYNSTSASPYPNNPNSGFSCRCVKD